MTETTPLLFDEPPSPQRAALGYNGALRPHLPARSTSSRFSSYPAQRHRPKVNALNPAYITSSTSYSKRSTSQIAQIHKAQAPAFRQISVSPRLSHFLYSLPYKLLCVASPHVPTCCGLCCCLTCIRTSEYGMLEQFGKFERVLDPGMHFILWPYEREAGRVSIRIRQLDLHCETKSKDHVFVTARLSIQYQAISHHLFESFYSLSSPNDQLTALTLDTLRSKLPQMDLDDIFSSYDDIAIDLHRTLNGAMNKYGFVIHHILLTQLQPNDHVRHSMNEIQASKRIKEAASHKAEANKVELVKDAEAKAERAYLNGVGIARQRKTLASGMQEVILDAQASNTSVSSKGVMDLLVLTQYIDVITSLNIGGKKDESDGDVHVNSSLILSHMPDIVGQLQDIVRESFASPIEDVKVENLLNTE
ncbi:hypothetical protein ACHAWO_004897 [Cyclotella atomus]|uniref:Band 7 domain-containing protein n=1 Tax=Cyclotella atomus TaxID=382360 RepID=A0ABD3PAK9_9STRA